jgi:hypothetical protein
MNFSVTMTLPFMPMASIVPALILIPTARLPGKRSGQWRRHRRWPMEVAERAISA